MDTKKELTTVTFGSVTVMVELPSAEVIKQNIRDGQLAFARARKAFITKGVKLDVPKGTPLYQAHSNNPKFLLRNIDGKVEQGILENGKFKVTDSLETL